MLDAAAQALGLDLAKFHADMNSSALKAILDKAEADFESRAQPKGQIGTPTVFLDGVQIQPPQGSQSMPSLSELRGLIEQRAAGKQ
jgi:protein-disulfide isomerase